MLFRKSPEKRGQILAAILMDRKYSQARAGEITEQLAEGATIPEEFKGEGVLGAAIHHQHARLIEAYLAQGRSVHVKWRGAAPVVVAMRTGNFALARQLLNRGADIEATDGYYRTNLLMLALRHGNVKMARSLIKKGLDVHAEARNGYTALFAAIDSGNAEVVKFVLQYKPDLAQTYDNSCLTTYSLGRGNRAIYELLVTAGLPQDPRHKVSYRGSGMTLLDYIKHYQSGDGALRARLQAQQDVYDAEKAAQKKAARTGWRKLGDQEVCLISEAEEIKYKVTEIFNFSSGLYTRINENLKTKAESASTMDMSSLTSGTLVEEARAALEQLGGSLPAAKAPTLALKMEKR